MPSTKKYLRKLVQIHVNDTEYYFSHGFQVYNVISHTAENVYAEHYFASKSDLPLSIVETAFNNRSPWLKLDRIDISVKINNSCPLWY